MSFTRRLLAVGAALVLVAAACSDDDDGDGAEADTDAEAGAAEGEADTSEPGETVTVAASVPPTDHGWLGQIAAKAQEAADQWDDVEFRLVEAEDADSQASQIQTLINEEPDVLVVLPYDGEQLTPVAEQAMEAGIPVVNVDRLFATPEAARATILGDNYDIGVKAAEFLAEQLDCEGNVVEIQGIAGISVTQDRTQGFADTIEELCGNGIEIVAQQPADFLPDMGLQVMEAILQANDDIDAVYTHDDDMSEGVVAAIENAGREDEMILTGAGGSCNAFDRIEEGGLYAATYLYSPTMAGSAVNLARLIAQDRGMADLVEPEVPSEIIVPPTQVTQDNVDELRDLCFD
ncbi:MAG TPA: substrate-binding domain-containing protein [Acidimicrobiales bacterium]|nr:substrate-binding domain-containing protein [Acidimicrobiales bacterium]